MLAAVFEFDADKLIALWFAGLFVAIEDENNLIVKKFRDPAADLSYRRLYTEEMFSGFGALKIICINDNHKPLLL